MTMIIDMFSGTGELGRAVAAGLDEPTQILSLSDNYGPARMLQRGLTAINHSKGDF